MTNLQNDEIRQGIMMKTFCEQFDEEPDGLFFALAEDMYGWDCDDWAWYSQISDELEDLLNSKNKKMKKGGEYQWQPKK